MPSDTPAHLAASPTGNEPAVSAGSLSPRFLSTTLADAEILSRLDALARRGKLAGFEKGGPGGPLFTLEAAGAPFDYTLEAWSAHQGHGGGAGTTRLDLRMRLLLRTPLIFGVVIALTIWPGVWLTHSMLRAYFGFYTYAEWVTWAWYIPLTVLPLPWALFEMIKRSREAAYTSAQESIPVLVKTLDAKATESV
jgi:hypothetical protein